MSKDPAFMFYSKDFLTGCADLTMEERGLYITLMCLQHQKGRLSKKTIWLSLGFSLVLKFEDFVPEGKLSVDVLKKFEIDENGNYFNLRLEQEIIKRAEYSNSRKANGSKGGRPKKANGNHTENHMVNLCESTEEAYKNLHGDANVNVIESENTSCNLSGENFSKKVDPWMNPHKPNFEKIYEQVMGQKPVLMNEECLNLASLVENVPDFDTTLEASLKKLKNINFEKIGYKPGADWFLKPKNYAALRNGAYDEQAENNEKEVKNGFTY